MESCPDYLRMSQFMNKLSCEEESFILFSYLSPFRAVQRLSGRLSRRDKNKCSQMNQVEKIEDELFQITTKDVVSFSIPGHYSFETIMLSLLKVLTYI